jgi:hypothetical protein
MPRELGVKSLADMGNVMTENPEISVVAKIMAMAHENACFFMKEGVKLDDQTMYFLIDDIGGLNTAMGIISDGLTSMLGVSDPKPAVGTKKKTAPK